MDKEILVAWENLKKEIKIAGKIDNGEVVELPLFVDKEIKKLDEYFYSK